MESSGGGGFADPFDREVSRIAADVAEGYVTRTAAEEVYGVVWRGARIDEAATADLRARLRAGRVRIRLTAGSGLDAERGRLIRLDAQTAAQLGIGPGAIVELVNPRGAPLRAWVARLGSVGAGQAEVSRWLCGCSPWPTVARSRCARCTPARSAAPDAGERCESWRGTSGPAAGGELPRSRASSGGGRPTSWRSRSSGHTAQPGAGRRARGPGPDPSAHHGRSRATDSQCAAHRRPLAAPADSSPS